MALLYNINPQMAIEKTTFLQINPDFPVNFLRIRAFIAQLLQNCCQFTSSSITFSCIRAKYAPFVQTYDGMLRGCVIFSSTIDVFRSDRFRLYISSATSRVCVPQLRPANPAELLGLVGCKHPPSLPAALRAGPVTSPDPLCW